MSSTILRLPEVKHRVGLSRSQLYALIRLGKFPPQITLGPKSIGFLESEIEAWITDRRAERDQLREAGMKRIAQ